MSHTDERYREEIPMRDTDERYRLDSGTNSKFVAEVRLHSVALLEAQKSLGSLPSELPRLFSASQGAKECIPNSANGFKWARKSNRYLS